tara:strand:- start:269 stop:640 length:372 start_codon:yes stop_codon:yes gene_type:complete
MVDDKDDASREERQQKHKEDFDPPRVRQCVTRSVLPFFSFSRVEEQHQQRTQNVEAFYFSLSRDRACLIVSFLFSLSLSLSLLVHQMAPSIRAAKVFGNLAKVNERAILGAEVTPGLCQARNI